MIYLAFVPGGHGTNTPGKRTPYIKALGRRVKEHEFNEPVQDLVYEKLKKYGIHVYKLADGDRDVPLEERTDEANKIYWQYCAQYGKENVKAVFVATHFNAYDGTFAGHNPSGFSVHIYPGHRNKDAGRLAECLLNELKKGTRQINRGIKEDNFHVLRESVMPAALVENGFMDNPEEAAFMLDKDFQNEVATEYERGICKYFGIPYKPVQILEDDDMLEKAIVVNAFGDAFAAEPLAKRLQCPIYFRDTAEQIVVANTIYVCGGSKQGLKGSKFVELTGPDRWEAAEAIGNYTKKI